MENTDHAFTTSQAPAPGPPPASHGLIDAVVGSDMPAAERLAVVKALRSGAEYLRQAQLLQQLLAVLMARSVNGSDTFLEQCGGVTVSVTRAEMEAVSARPLPRTTLSAEDGDGVATLSMEWPEEPGKG